MSDWDAVREEGERISREEAYKVMQSEIAALHAEIGRLRQTAAKLYDIAASGADPLERRRMLDRMEMESFAENG